MRSMSVPVSPAAFRRDLLAWYQRSGRHDLPWRGDFRPYHVLLSEFMLQQTTVSAVIPYFHRFLKAFPDLPALARAPEEKVLELWAGLGYYARARNLRKAAEAVARDWGGRLPETREGCESLPGVGRYTAGALLSFAYDKAEALVDGNVIRVLSRIYGVDEDVKDPKVQEKIWALAWKLVPPKGARHFNSALMDLGASVCRPAGPDCLVCPFFQDCRARIEGRQEELPRASAARPRKLMSLHVGLIRRDGAWAMVRRPAKGLYAGMWEFPSVEASAEGGAAEAAKKLGLLLGADVRVQKELPPVTHILTHRELTLLPWLAAAGEGEGPAAWRSPAEIRRMAVSAYTLKLLKHLPAEEQIVTSRP
jgi:A/G-specific adenine glycosylase